MSGYDSRFLPASAERLLPVEPGHALASVAEKHHRLAEVDCHVQWFEERNTSGDLIARYRTWNRFGRIPPYRRQLGWEQYSPAGELLDREVRYGERAGMETLH